LQIFRAPLQNCVLYGIRAGVAPEEAERASGELGVNIYSYDVPPVARLAKQVRIDERVQRVPEGRGGTSVDGFPLQLEETGETAHRLAPITCDVLSFTRPVSPRRCDGNGPGGETNRGHGAEPMGARDNRIAAIEAELAAAVSGRHSDVLQHLIDAA